MSETTSGHVNAVMAAGTVVRMTSPGPSGTEWLIASNPKTYDAVRAFNILDEINWSETAAGIAIGDSVLLYGTLPIQAITHRCLVVETGVPFERRMNDDRYWTEPESLQDRRNRSWMRLRLLRAFDESERGVLSLDALKDRGLKGAPQGRMKAPPAVSRLVDSVARTSTY